MRSGDPEALLAAAVAGDRGATGRLLSLVERGGERAQQVARLTYPGGGAIDAVVGLTGAPGSGKSTLVDALAREARAAGVRVGVLAVDPSSPFTGGAILGDRVRMQEHTGDPGVFIRSMATKGQLGGLALAVPEAVRVLGAVGYPLVIVETVGVGQVEVEIAGAADTTVVVVTPGWGDSVQASKAGLLEAADVLVINKADRPGVEETRRDLAEMLDLDPSAGGWRPPIVATCALRSEGVADVWTQIRAHGEHLRRTGELEARRRRRLLDELERIVARRLATDVRALAGGALYERVSASMLAGETDPQSAAGELLAALVAGDT